MQTETAKRPVGRPRKTPKPAVKNGGALRRVAERAKLDNANKQTFEYPIKPPEILPGVVPKGKKAPVLAMDDAPGGINPYTFAQQAYGLNYGFPGFQYLSMLTTRPEYRAFATTLSTEMTREWIEFTSSETEGDVSNDKIKQIEDEFKRLNIRGLIQKVVEHDCYFGRGHIYMDIRGADKQTPLILDSRVVPKGSLKKIVAVEPIWTTPATYNALDPAAPDFYKPSKWFMLGQEVHASRFYTLITRPLPDMLKPAYNFAGMSLSQLAEPYVNNWLRTRQSVSDLLNNFSLTILATAMDQVLQGNDDGVDLFARADLFTATKSNRGLMLVDKDREEISQVNTPLSGLHELQAQAQEQQCSVSRIPTVILTGISPAGLNASSEGEIRTFYDWIAANQESFYREPIDIILKLVQLNLFGEIDPSIGFSFIPLYQMTEKELAEIRLSNQQASTAYIDAGVLDPMEVREHLAADPDSGYMGIDTSVEIVAPADPENELEPESVASEDKDK